ncbi:hypothetical protein FEZ51_07120 [Pediococcus stilesii]|uniref:Uncharacterized protein n=2 Tax=Pediococcus stilesii TaxID=331679 RepID=A0A5R9BUY7_9LACO|nr:hypothetical protein FEZ51_07120 [Pediococcus stilesii]
MNDEIVRKDIERNKAYGSIKERIDSIDIFRRKFIDDPFTEVILVNKTDNRNSMRLNLVFKDERRSRKIIIGLRKIHDSVYVPVTLFVTKNRNFDYAHSKRIKMDELSWF